MDFSSEYQFSFSRSGGKGGQHVNKVSTQVELRFSVAHSTLLNEEQKNILLKKWAPRLNLMGEIILKENRSRSQLNNKKNVIHRFEKLIQQGLKKPKPRIATKLPKTVLEKRKLGKQLLSTKKETRKKISPTKDI